MLTNRKRFSLEEIQRAFYSATVFKLSYSDIEKKIFIIELGVLSIYKKEIFTDGMICKKCNIFNEYVTTPNQLDNSYVCYGCRSGF